VATQRRDFGHQQPQVIRDFRGGSDRAAARPLGPGTSYRDRWRNAIDRIAIGLIQPLQKLPRVGRKALDVATLTFGVERIEGEAGFTAARKSTHDDQSAARDIDIDPFKIMNPTAANTNHGWAKGSRHSPSAVSKTPRTLRPPSAKVAGTLRVPSSHEKILNFRGAKGDDGRYFRGAKGDYRRVFLVLALPWRTLNFGLLLQIT